MSLFLYITHVFLKLSTELIMSDPNMGLGSTYVFAVPYIGRQDLGIFPDIYIHTYIHTYIELVKSRACPFCNSHPFACLILYRQKRVEPRHQGIKVTNIKVVYLEGSVAPCFRMPCLFNIVKNSKSESYCEEFIV
jgi:hypothetical protein